MDGGAHGQIPVEETEQHGRADEGSDWGSSRTQCPSPAAQVESILIMITWAVRVHVFVCVRGSTVGVLRR